jgi:Flp pilus assembly protein TadG
MQSAKSAANLLHQLRRDHRGTSVIELALALPFLSVMLVGLVDVASCYSAQMSIQQAAARSLERVQVAGPSGDFAFVRTEAASAAGVPVSQVTVETWLECDNVKQAATVQTCSETQASANYVKVTISSSYAPYFGYSPLGARTSDGRVPLSASASVRYS